MFLNKDIIFVAYTKSQDTLVQVILNSNLDIFVALICKMLFRFTVTWSVVTLLIY